MHYYLSAGKASTWNIWRDFAEAGRYTNNSKIFDGKPLTFADQVYGRILKAGRVVEENMTEALFCNPREDYTRMLIQAAPKPKWDEAGAMAV